MSAQKIEQILTELKLLEADEASKIFGKFQSVTKIYVKNQTSETITSILCIHLNRVSTIGTTVINSVDTYIFTVLPPLSENYTKKLLEYKGDGKVTIIDNEDKITLGKKTLSCANCFFVCVPSKVDEGIVYDIMSQLTKPNVDFSDVFHVSIQNIGGNNDWFFSGIGTFSDALHLVASKKVNYAMLDLLLPYCKSSLAICLR